MQVISAGQLLEWLADLLLDLREGDQASRPDFQVYWLAVILPERGHESEHYLDSNWRNKEPSSNILQHNINDAIAVLPKLQTGLDVNVRFTGVMELCLSLKRNKIFPGGRL